MIQIPCRGITDGVHLQKMQNLFLYLQELHYVLITHSKGFETNDVLQKHFVTFGVFLIGFLDGQGEGFLNATYV